MRAPHKINATLVFLCLVALAIAFFRVYGGPADVIKNKPAAVVESKTEDFPQAEVFAKGTTSYGSTITVFKYEDKEFTVFFTHNGGITALPR